MFDESQDRGRASEYADADAPTDFESTWNDIGYDATVATRWVYAFVLSDLTRVKVGMVGNGSRLAKRHREVAADHDPRLWYAADVAIPDVDSQTVEGIEMSMQTWLALAAGLPFAGFVDWLIIPPDHLARGYDAEAWRRLLRQARAAVLGWRDLTPDL